MTGQGKAYLLALAAVLMWSTVATAFKLSLRFLGTAELLFFASLTSTAVLGAWLVLSGRAAALRSLSRRDLVRSALLGLLNPVLYYAVLFEAYRRLPAQEAQPLNYTWALTLALLSVPVLGHPFRPRDAAAALVCLAGVLLIATRGDPASFRLSDPHGVALALGSTVLWAVYWMANARSRRDAAAGLFLSFLASLPVLAAVWILAGPGPALPPVQGLLGAAYVGVFEMGLAFLLWLEALRRTRSTARIANLIFLSPFLSLVFIRFVLGEILLASSVLGLGLIVAGLLLQRAGKAPEPRT